MQDQRGEMKEALAAVLAEEQLDQFKEMKASGKGREPGGGKGRGHRRGHPIMHAPKKLDLSGAQPQRVVALFASR